MATTPDLVVPNSLNFTDIKPQAVENKIQLVRYQPTATVNGLKGGDMIKFLLSGNGFLDPYSTYFQFSVSCDDLAPGEARFLDRSAHSFISRLVIRSQGVEIERIEHYDVIASMINDMVYSPEQAVQHYWEGFPTHSANISGTVSAGQKLTSDILTGNEMSPLQFTAVDYRATDSASIAKAVIRSGSQLRSELLRWLNNGASPTTTGYIGEVCFYNPSEVTSGINLGDSANTPLDYPVLVDLTLYQEVSQQSASIALNQALNADAHLGMMGNVVNQWNVLYPGEWAYHQRGMRVPVYDVPTTAKFTPKASKKMTFIIPIYSGLLGLLMPEKKLLPLNLLPLDIEIVFNQHALYSSFATGSRNYKINEFYIYGNTLFFEQEIHRTLEASVADHGLFIYCNGFHSAPQQIISTRIIPTTNYISMNLKSINSVHWVYLYTHYENSQKPCARKLHFVSHNLTKVQLLNGTQLIPQYPVEGDMGSSADGGHTPFLVELYKAWNKLHDPTRDGALHAYNICGDQYAGQMDPILRIIPYTLRHVANAPDASGIIASGDPTSFSTLQGFGFESVASVSMTAWQIANKQGNVGRCQYGISLEGEELGSDRTMITGRKAQYPFQLQIWSNGKWSDKPSYMLTFLRADYIVYIRPDLQVVTLGK